MGRFCAVAAGLVFFGGCVCLPVFPPSSPGGPPQSVYFDQANICETIREAIPVGMPLAEARAALERSGFRGPSSFGISCYGWLPPPYVLYRQVGDATLRIEVRLFGSDRVEKVDIAPGYAWGVSEEAQEGIPVRQWATPFR